MLSETTRSVIGSAYLTHDGTNTGQFLRAFWTDYPWFGIRRTVTPTIAGVVVQEFSFGTKGRPVTIEIPYCPAALYDLLQAQRQTASTTYGATLIHKEGETSVVFTSLVWLDLTFDTRRIGSYVDIRDVRASLISTA